MRRILLATFVGVAAMVAGSVAARAIVDGRLQVTATKDGKKYQVEEAILGKPEFFGYVRDYIETKKITGMVLLHGDRATDEQKHVMAITAYTQGIQAFIDLDGKVQPLVDPTPTPPKPAAAPAPAAVPAAAADPAAPATPATDATPQ